MIDQLSEHELVEMVCSVLNVPRSSYYDFKQRVTSIKLEEVQLRSTINELFSLSRGAAGSRMLAVMLKEADLPVGVFKVRRIMRDMGLVCKQPGLHSYKLATAERPNIPNKLNREFKVNSANQVWCGGITYIWTGKKWSYLAVIIDLFARRVVGWAMSDKLDTDLVIKALDKACEHRKKVSTKTVALPDRAKYLSQRELFGQGRLFRCLKTEWVP